MTPTKPNPQPPEDGGTKPLDAGLASCPFCGGDAVAMQSAQVGGYGYKLHWVKCSNFDEGCEAQTQDKRFPQQAIAAWNRRAPDAALPADLVELLRVAEACVGLDEEYDKSTPVELAAVEAFSEAITAELIVSLLSRLTAAEAERDALGKALDLALPRVAHRFSCWTCRPSSEWAEHGSASFDGCNCERKVVLAALADFRRAHAITQGER